MKIKIDLHFKLEYIVKKTLLFIAIISFCVPSVNAQSHDLYANDGTYLGNTGNQYDSNSVNNPYGKYGSQYSQDSINNQYGRYGSQYSNTSPNNPYADNGRAVNTNNNTYRCFGSNQYGGCQ